MRPCVVVLVALFALVCASSHHRKRPHAGFAFYANHADAMRAHSSLHRESNGASDTKHHSNISHWTVQRVASFSEVDLLRDVNAALTRVLGDTQDMVHRTQHKHARLPPYTAIYSCASNVPAELMSLTLARELSASHIVWFDRHVRRQSYHRYDVSTPLMVDRIHMEPLYAAQWHLHNNNARGSYWEKTQLAPDHLSVHGVWQQGVFGHGVHVAVVDDGLDHAHPDFAGRYDAMLSHDYDDDDDEPSPRARDSHGTAAAGLIAAGVNGVCGVGVAPLARVAGVRLIASPVTDYAEALALTHHDDVIAIYSNSWGPQDDGLRLEAPGPLTQHAMEVAVQQGRNGSGTIYVWASGNGRHNGDSCAYDGYASTRLVITVGAVGYFGSASYYSEGCAAMLCVAPSSGSEGPDEVRRISTTDLRGQYGDNSGDCLSNFGGTSAAAPLVAGVVALLLGECPWLGWRDVQQILARTSTRVDPTSNSWQYTGAGLWHSHQYGFGRVNASAALALARQWSPLPRDELMAIVNTANEWTPLAIVGTGLQQSNTNVQFDVPDRLTVEFVDVYINIVHPQRGALELLLYSPMGTRSELALLHRDSNANYTLWRFGSRSVLGERSMGVWRLSARDLLIAALAPPRGTIEYAELRIYGHNV